MDPTAPASSSRPAPLTPEQLRDFGLLLRDRRLAAGLTRVQLACKAGLSESTLKFLETAHHPPRPATLLRLLKVSELRLHPTEVPGGRAPPVALSIDPSNPDPPGAQSSWLHSQLNCFLTPSYDSLTRVADLARFLQGAGGHVEQSQAYLDHYSAAAYLAICQNSIDVASLRAHMPLALVAKQIQAASGPLGLQVIALGAGDGVVETLLVRHLLDAQVPRIELDLLDISQPLLGTAYRHAADALVGVSAVKVWAIQCDFHHLPLYTQLYRSPTDPPLRRLFCMLGGTLANLDHEPRFLRQSLLDCQAEDLLLLDLQTVCAACEHPAEIKRRDRLYCGGVPPQVAAWLGGPIWRLGKDIERVDFHWHLDTCCLVPGSYALHAVATVKSQRRADRQFSMFRFGRYEPSQLAACLSEIGWEEIGALGYAGQHSLRLYRRRD